MKLKRDEYYTDDKYGYFLFSVTRCYNDLSIIRLLLGNSDDIKVSDETLKLNYKLYIMKMYFSHLKEAMKLLNKIRADNGLYDHFCNDNIKKEFDKLKDELSFADDSVNKKYLNIRHDVFHYDKDDKTNIPDYIKSNKQLCENGMNVVVNLVKNQYFSETACDVLTLTKYFGCKEIPSEVIELFNCVCNILQQILTYNLNRKSD